MITKQEQEILDNAPEGATHYVTDLGFGGYYKDIAETNYMFHGGISWKAGSGRPVIDYAPLADLRKKQGKTVWDAVNLLESSLSNLTNGHVSTAFRLIIAGHSTILSGTESTLAQFNRSNTDSHYVVVCTIEEFNQCVKEMSEHNKGVTWDELEKPVKPRMKVEYVKVVDSIFGLEADFRSGNLYTQTFSDEWVQINVCHYMARMYDSCSIYRKVETEIKTEKRWLVYEMDGSFHGNYYKEPRSHVAIGRQIIEITVEV